MAKKKPNIRFKGFEEEWKETQFSKEAETRRGLTYSPSSISKNGVRVLRSSNIADDTFVISSDDVFVERDAINIDYAKNDDILITSANGSQRLVGKHCIINGIGNNSAVHGGFMLLATAKNPHFLNASMGSSWYHDFIKFFVAGGNGAIGNLNKADLDNYTINVPSPTEQQKIGEFFKQLDELIGAKEEELEKLRQIKLALLDKMFPSDSQDVTNTPPPHWNSLNINKLCKDLVMTAAAPNIPAIRFRGFTEPWEKKTFGDFGHVSMCKRVMKYQTSEKGDVPFFKIGTFGEKPDAFISYELFNCLKSNYPYPRKGDILISAAGTLGRLVEFNGEDQYFQDSNIVWLNHEDSLHNPFLKVLYHVVKWNSVEGSTLKRLYNSNILNTEIFVPSKAEQRKIGDFFRSQDEAINSSQEQIIKLKYIKQACMQQMFA